MDQNSTIQRRYMQPLPSRKKHALLAISTITACLGFMYLAAEHFGSPQDARVSGSVPIITAALPPASDSLSGDSEALPDLLAGDVEDGENPTLAIADSQAAASAHSSEQRDALGNLAGGTPHRTSDSAGAAPSQPNIITVPTISTAPSTSGPRVITIDGKPIDGSDKALPPAPISGLTQSSPFGQIPAISAGGLTSLSAYKRPFTPAAGLESVSLIIGGLGVNSALTEQAINELPADVTLSFAAHSRGLNSWIAKARAKGHEVLLELPFESAEFNAGESGADRTLMVTRNTDANPRNLNWLLSRGQGYFGITNYNGDVFLTRADAAAPLLDRLARLGLGFVFDGSYSAGTLPALASAANLPFASGYTLIDTVQDGALITSELERLSAAATSGSGPIGVGFTYPETLSAVKSWTAGLKAQGLELAPASAALR